MSSCKLFDVISCIDFVNDHCLREYISNNSKLPDHPIIMLKVQLESMTVPDHVSQSEFSKPTFLDHVRFNTKESPNDFMESPETVGKLLECLENFDLCNETQVDIDNMYTTFLNILLDEMHKKLRLLNPKKHKKRNSIIWNDELNELLERKKIADKEFRICHSNVRQLKRAEFKQACNMFNKRLRYFERQAKQDLMYKLENLESNNPQMFWSEISKLGPKSRYSIPLEVYDAEGRITYDIFDVLNKWKTEFQQLYKIEEAVLDDNFIQYVKLDNRLKEMTMIDPLYVCDQNLNCGITFS